jgi:hypothetical protein
MLAVPVKVGCLGECPGTLLAWVAVEIVTTSAEGGNPAAANRRRRPSFPFARSPSNFCVGTARR